MTAHPERFGKYEVLSVLGKGGMGVVYQARDPLIDRIVAIKTIPSDADETRDDLLKRLTMEARSAGRLQHRNIVTIHDFGVQDDVSYIVMEYVEGTNLGAMIASRENIPLDRKLDILVQLCDGMAYAHELGVLHRDLKPSNVAITAKGVVKILDFGLARFDSTRLTQAGFLSGTIPYMSPERINGEAGASDDIFAIGAIAYEFFAFQRAFRGRTAPEVMYQVLNNQPLPLSKLAKVPEELDSIVLRALEKDPVRRFQSARELGARLADFRRSPAFKSYVTAGRLVDSISDSTGARRAEMDRTIPRTPKTPSPGIEDRLRDLTPQRTRSIDPLAVAPTAPMMEAPVAEESPLSTAPVFAPEISEPMPTEIETPMPVARPIPAPAVTSQTVIDEPEPQPLAPTAADVPLPAPPIPQTAADVPLPRPAIPPTAADVPLPLRTVAPTRVDAPAVLPTLAETPLPAGVRTLEDQPFTAPRTENAPITELMPPAPVSRGPRLGMLIVGIMILALVGVGALAVYKFVSSRGSASPQPPVASKPDATALVATVNAQQASFQQLRAQAATRSWSEQQLAELQQIDQSQTAALGKMQQNDAAAASAMLGDSINRLQQLLNSPPPQAAPAPAPDTAGQAIADALEAWTRVNATIDDSLERARRDGVTLDKATASSLADRKQAVFALLEGGRLDEFSAQTGPLVKSYQDAIRKARNARTTPRKPEEPRTAEITPAPAPEPVEEVAPPEPAPVEAARAESATVLKRVPPRVPSSMVRMREGGTVVVAVDIDESGNVRDARIVQSVTPQFDVAAVRAAKQWKFRPATISGRPVASSMNLEFEFKP